MSDFLKAWDEAVRSAQENYSVGYVLDRRGDEVRIVARTRHAAFMGIVPPKHDPKRDERSA